MDSRSDDKGPEPEGIAVGEVDGELYAFVGLERVGGIMMFSLSDPRQPKFVTYQNTMQFREAPQAGAPRELIDSGPEGLLFISADKSPTDRPLLVVGFEVSGTTRVYELTKVATAN